ncbi:hypothetical protein Tco_0813720 [Tanacetum coccineum]
MTNPPLPWHGRGFYTYNETGLVIGTRYSKGAPRKSAKVAKSGVRAPIASSRGMAKYCDRCQQKKQVLCFLYGIILPFAFRMSIMLAQLVALKLLIYALDVARFDMGVFVGVGVKETQAETQGVLGIHDDVYLLFIGCNRTKTKPSTSRVRIFRPFSKDIPSIHDSFPQNCYASPFLYAELAAAVQAAVDAMLPQIREQVREEYRNGASGSGGNPPPVTIHTWLERFNKQKPRN